MAGLAKPLYKMIIKKQYIKEIINYKIFKKINLYIFKKYFNFTI